MSTLTIAEAASVAGVSVRTVRRWIASGHVVTVGRGQGKRVVAASLSKPADTNGQNGHETGHPMGQVSAKEDTETTTTANSDKAAIEADRLAVLVRELSDRLAEQTGLTAVWMERCRVLSDQLALAAPSERPQEGQEPPEAPEATPEPRSAVLTLLARFWPLLVAVVVLVAAGAWVLLAVAR
jgi:excisionase family DNA binding protein